MTEEKKKLSRKEVKIQLKNLIGEFQKTPKLKNRKPKKPKEKLNPSKMDSIQETIDYLRVCIKYNVFDLEATKRENEYLRKLLEENEIK